MYITKRMLESKGYVFEDDTKKTFELGKPRKWSDSRGTTMYRLTYDKYNGIGIDPNGTITVPTLPKSGKSVDDRPLYISDKHIEWLHSSTGFFAFVLEDDNLCESIGDDNNIEYHYADLYYAEVIADELWKKLGKADTTPFFVGTKRVNQAICKVGGVLKTVQGIYVKQGGNIKKIM